MIRLDRLRCEGMQEPVGISEKVPCFSWILISDEKCVKQEAFQFFLYEESETGSKNRIYDSGKVEGSKNTYKIIDFTFLSGMRYFWQVKVKSNKSNWICSDLTWFETGLLHEEDWKAEWIRPERPDVAVNVKEYVGYDEPKMSKIIPEETLLPCPMIRQNFLISKRVIKARVYATAHGIYRLLMNGKRVGNLEFAPEITPYGSYLQVQAYDATECLVSGENAFTIVLAEGWWAGCIGYYGESVQYGRQLAALVQIHVWYEDGTMEIFGSNESAVSCDSARQYGELYIGEKYDAKKEDGVIETQWIPVHVENYGYSNLVGQNAQPMQVVRTVDAVNIYNSKKGEKIIDFGQAMAGNAVMHIQSEPGAVVTMDYFETTDKDGNYWFELDGRNSQQTDTFVLSDSGEGDYDPWFTYHGYRYIRISSDKGEVQVSDVKGRLIASAVDQTMHITTSNEKINRLQKNIEWTLLSNMVSVLTDNPDRERAGWTGDLQMILPTLSYNMDVQSFIKRWMQEARLEQFENGLMPIVIPYWDTYKNMPFQTSPGWGDVVTIVPWLMYQRYGDENLLADCYEMMKKWVDYETERAAILSEQAMNMPREEQELERYLWNADYNFGDWLTPSACYDQKTDTYTYYTQTLCYLTGPYYHAYSAKIMEKAAGLLGYEDDQKKYARLHDEIKHSVIEQIYKKGGILESEYMGAQVLALHMGLYPAGEKEKLIERMLELIKTRGMDCGFSSVLEIFGILCESGHKDIAYEFLFNESFPSWLYEVDQGATTVWESMQAIMPDGTRNAVSFIQPAFCSVGNWMVEGMCGIAQEEAGFRKIRIAPCYADRLDFVEGEYQSAQGRIFCRWEKDGNMFRINVDIPANTSADIYFPEGVITESGITVKNIEKCNAAAHDRKQKVAVGSGKYEFCCLLQSS